ncbi:P-loop containing nucleoside triphosphate hydrolase protein [Chaetomium sp. MPI-CAGE-AT-0009]|nr:P-loop containing nucleoside triphosphate hydrolase protein [Chaetomium sp. MPI-CAGE-AT-0009]
MDQPATTFGSIGGKNVIAGTNVAGSLNLAINNNSYHEHPAPCYSIPFPRNEGVIHRTAISNRLAALLPPSREYHSAALWGLGGSGKTQIALDYAYCRCHDDPTCSVFWVHADSVASFTQDYTSIAMKLGLPESLSGKDLLMGVRAGIEANRCWLLVIDSADNLQLFGVRDALRARDQDQTEAETLNLLEFIPRGPVGTVLWTSRDKGIESLVGVQRAIEVARMADDEAMELLKTVGGIGDGDLDGAAELLAELDCLPLALSQAAAFMRRMSITIREYLSRLASSNKRWRVLQNSVHDPHRRQGLTNSVLETWDISMEQIRQENEVAFDILHMLAFLGNQNIPFKILYRAVTVRNEMVPDDDEDDNEEEALQAAARLQEFSFLHCHASEGKSRAYEMHKLVQEATRYALTHKDKRKDQVRYSELALRVVADLFPGQRGQEHWEECERYVVHAQRVAEWAGLCEEETEALELLTKVSAYLSDRGMWKDKVPVHKMIYDLGVKTFGGNHHAAINSWVFLTTTYYEQGRYKEAEELAVEVLGLGRVVLGDRHPDTILAMVFLAITRHAQKRSPETVAMLKDSSALVLEILGADHPYSRRCLELLGKLGDKEGGIEVVDALSKVLSS